MVPTRQTFGLVPPGTDVWMYIVFAPFALLFCAGVYLRLRDSGVVSLIATGPGGIYGALRRLLVLGLLQKRVSRRATGWPHLAIFAGFIALLIGTTIVAVDWDVTRPFGTRLLVGTPYLVLESFLDAFGVIFVLGLSVALVRRVLRLKRSSLDQRKMHLQFALLIVGLLYMGVTGFLLEGLRLTLRPAPGAEWSFAGNLLVPSLQSTLAPASSQTLYVVLWWSHAIVAFTLISSLPYTAFLHSMMAPVNLMIHPGRPALALSTPFDLREITESGAFDVKPGASTLQDLGAAQRTALLACTNCGRCENVCPANASGTALSPRAIVQALRREELQGSRDKDLIEEGVIQPAAVWACTTCAACVQECPVLIRPVDYIVPFRRELVARQMIDKRQNEFLANLGRSSNPYGLPANSRSRLAEELTAGHPQRRPDPLMRPQPKSR